MSRPLHHLLFSTFLFTGLAHAQDVRIPPPAWAIGKPPGEAAYAPPVSPVPNWYEVRGGDWQVPLETVRAMRTLIDARIGTNRHFGGKAPISTHATYAIQFRGESKDGRRLVRLAGACHVHDTPPWQLSESFFNVNDGGECYFDAEYDPLEQRLDNFRYHGHA